MTARAARCAARRSSLQEREAVQALWLIHSSEEQAPARARAVFRRSPLFFQPSIWRSDSLRTSLNLVAPQQPRCLVWKRAHELITSE